MQIKLILLLLWLCSVVWGSCSKVLPKYNKLQNLRNRAACVLTFSNYDADDLQLLKKLIWDNLETRLDLIMIMSLLKYYRYPQQTCYDKTVGKTHYCFQ